MRSFVDRYLIKGLGGMASGLFCTLIIGLIIKQVGLFFPDTAIGNALLGIAGLATVLTGVGIGIGTAHQLEASKLVLYASAINGLIGAYATGFLNGSLIVEGKVILSGPGDPVGAFLATVIGLEIGRLVAGKTKLDILVTPAVTILAGSATALLLGPPISSFMTGLGSIIGYATELQPFLMGIVISVLMGMFLTLPISSAAIAMMLGLSGLAAGAATAGCTAQMIGFAVISYRENKVGGLLAQGLGTSMLQVPNIVRNPRIWLPPIIASAITGPIATMIFKMENVAAGAGMGTAGLVGPIFTWQTMIETTPPMEVAIAILLVQFILPAGISLLVSEMMRKREWIKMGDLQLEL
ncbi:PTS sugar transporter subunit IIC [Niameybacter massiliensis]|uniref:PTS sugar transporter subunit IIC n=1 Tax=Holtiella tumoricola TaxID=3018743 RepID=A0AA42DK34_9FIRM|nr:PTS sugar transporter subunit IIC [Holtiella tumoricola]MDA3730476.1 PTS sugar transporter subunit IIC [Holtiella tumoricola]